MPERIVRAEVSALRDELVDHARVDPLDVTLDASAVQAVDGAGLQILLAYRNDLAQRGGSLTLVGCSRVLARALALVGLADRFHLRAESEAP